MNDVKPMILCGQFNKESQMKKISMLFLLLLSTMVLAGCNTVQGVGKDVQRGGAALEEAAKES